MVLKIGESVSPQADPGRMARPQVELGGVGTQSVQGGWFSRLAIMFAKRLRPRCNQRLAHIPKSWEISPS